MKKYILEIGDKEFTAELKGITTEEANVVVNGTEYKVKLKSIGRKKVEVPQVTPAAAPAPAPKPAPTPARATAGDSAGIVRAPLPGLILDLMVKAGDTVKAGQNMMIMEAMKMENNVQAPHDGQLKQVFVNKGDSVQEGDNLVEIERAAMALL